MTRKQFARKHSDKRQLNIDPADRKAALLALPLQTHVDMVTLTLDNLEMKLCGLGETQDTMRAAETMNTEDVELLRRLSERLMQQRERIERMCGGVVLNEIRLKLKVQ